MNKLFGKGGSTKIIRVRYLVIDSWSVYNIVIGRSAVSDLRAVIPTIHLTMKYPVVDGVVGVVRADLEMVK